MMATTITPPKSRFLGKAAVKREQRGACSGTAERKQARRFGGRSTSGRLLPARLCRFARRRTGRKNGMSRTAMFFKIATLAGHRLTIPEMNRFKEVNPRQLEHVYEEVVRMGDPGNALFALRLILK